MVVSITHPSWMAIEISWAYSWLEQPGKSHAWWLAEEVLSSFHLQNSGTLNLGVKNVDVILGRGAL